MNRLLRLARARSGVAMTEFALSLPLLLGAGMWGAEAANQAIVQMRLSQVAVQIADNASRIGDNSVLEKRKIYESDINDLLIGSNIQAGLALDLYEHGRVIISSLEVVPDSDGDQYIHWQRCKGRKIYDSSYGGEGTGMGGELAGMGPPGEEITAFDDEAVIFVEVAYDYQPLISESFTYATTLTATAAFNVRGDRDLSQIYQRDPDQPDEIASCDKHTGFDTISA
jgi:hypothetical protein